ncbi:kinase-like protein, partial [Obba rivulosa]
LRKLCATNRMFPSSLDLAISVLKLDGKRPEASGGFADVWKGNYGGREVAVKVFPVHYVLLLRPSIQALFKEGMIWKHLRRPNVTPFIGVNMELFRLSLVSEWMPHGTVLTFLKEYPATNRLNLALDIVNGLKYLHDMGIVHGDLKGNNVQVNAHHTACLSGFQCHKMHYIEDLAATSIGSGTVRWMAPELFDPESYGLSRVEITQQSDIYALGITIWELFSERPPFHAVLRDVRVIQHILSGMRPSRPQDSVTLGLSDEVWSLVEQCWSEDRHQRPDSTTIIERLSSALSSAPVYQTRLQVSSS